MTELPSVYRETNPVARKEHRCCECPRTVQPGERYRAAWGAWCGETRSYAMCADCAALWDRAHAEAEHPEDGPAFGDLHEWWTEALR